MRMAPSGKFRRGVAVACWWRGFLLPLKAAGRLINKYKAKSVNRSRANPTAPPALLLQSRKQQAPAAYAPPNKAAASKKNADPAKQRKQIR
jgi:hypothetical protein